MCTLGFVMPSLMALRLGSPTARLFQDHMRKTRAASSDKQLTATADKAGADDDFVDFAGASVEEDGPLLVQAKSVHVRASMTISDTEKSWMWVVLVFGLCCVGFTGYFSIDAVVTSRSPPNPLCNS